MTFPPSAKEIEKIARRTTDIIKERITTDVCLFGSAAAYLWADIGRVPNDIDILVHAPFCDAERIKEIIVEEDDRYFLKPSKRNDAEWEILMCRLPGWHADGRCMKVDILTSGNMDLPEIQFYETFDFDGIPVMPLFELLVMKTHGWWDHHISTRNDFRAKLGADVVDIDALLDRAKEQGIKYDDELSQYKHLYDSEFMEMALRLARRFVKKHGRRWKWRAIGFPL